MPKVLNKRTDNISEDAVYVGRPSKWGNPFKIGQVYGVIASMTREQVISQYEDWLCWSNEGLALCTDLIELKGKDLVCWCAPLPCHADVLLEIANH